MRQIIFFFLLLSNSIISQQRVFKFLDMTQSTAVVVSGNSNVGNPMKVWGNFNYNYPTDKSSVFLVYTVEDIDSRFKSVFDSIAEHKKNYIINKKNDSDSLRIYFNDIQKNLKRSIDSIPQVLTETEVARIIKEQIILDLKKVEISNFNTEILRLKESIDSLKQEIVQLKKTK